MYLIILSGLGANKYPIKLSHVKVLLGHVGGNAHLGRNQCAFFGWRKDRMKILTKLKEEICHMQT